MGPSKKRTRALPIELVSENALRFWFACGNPIDNRDILIYALVLLGHYLGLRHDEINKMRIENVSLIPGIDVTGSTLLFIPASFKNSSRGRECIVRNWNRNSKLRNYLITEPFIALLLWMKLRGNRLGYLLCLVNKKNMIFLTINGQYMISRHSSVHYYVCVELVPALLIFTLLIRWRECAYNCTDYLDYVTRIFWKSFKSQGRTRRPITALNITTVLLVLLHVSIITEISSSMRKH